MKPVHASQALWFVVIALLCGAAAADVRTGELDTRTYRYLELDNGLRAIVVHDPETDKAAASLDVAVGHGSDPVGRDGLAHFLEHMLFLGTDRYPEAGEYQSYIKDHGGGHNAYTSYDHTNYFFDIQPDYLEPALDRFSRFFVAPLFNEDLVKRERVVVHSEYSARSDNEARRTWAARRQAMNPEHPRSRFAVGSLDTLADREGSPVRDDLIAFYRSRYSAGVMTLAVIGRQSLDELETLVREKFSEVPDTGAGVFVSRSPLYRSDDLPLLQRVVPLKEQRHVTFSFPVPETMSLYRQKPLHQIANILGHEAEGSLLQAFKQRGWGRALSAGVDNMDTAGGTMEVAIDLTPVGLDHLDEIGEMLFSMIRKIADRGLERWRFDEQRRLSEIGFRYAERAEPMRLVQSLASRLHDYPASDVLYAPYAFEDFDPELVRSFLSRLTPENLAVTVVAPDQRTDRVESRFDVAYAIEPLPEQWRSRWQSPANFDMLALPSPNPFVPDDLRLVAAEAGETPAALVDEPRLQLWHRADIEFGAPRAELYFSFQTPRAMRDVSDSVLSDLLTRVVDDKLNAFSYPAYLAGLGYEVYPHLRGLSVRISGFSQRQPELLQRIADTLRDGHFDAERFARIHTALLEEYRNRLRESPSSLAIAELQRLLIVAATPLEARIDALDAVTFEDFVDYAGKFFEQGRVVALAHGNVSADGARRIGDILEHTLLAGVEPVAVERSPVVRLGEGNFYRRQLSSPHPDSVVALYLQGREDSVQERARFYLFSQLVDSDFYHQLRTVGKLGYIVQSFPMPVLDVPGMVFLVQSPSATTAVTEKAIGDFLGGLENFFAGLDEARFERVRAGLLARIQEQDVKLAERSQRYWREIDDGDLGFDSRDRLADAVAGLGIDELRSFNGWLRDAGNLVLSGNGSVERGSDDPEMKLSRSEIVDADAFKEEHAVF